jgi:hypothetical protein
VALWDARKNAPDAQRKAFATLIFSWATIFFTAHQLWGSQGFQDYLSQSYFWLLIGNALSCSDRPSQFSNAALPMIGRERGGMH